MDKEKFSKLMYALTKNAARESFNDFLEYWEITNEEYDEIRDYLVEEYGIITYV